MTIEKLLIDLMLGLPDITVLTFGVVVVVACIIALLYRGLKFNPKSDS